jgi:apolipoprotein N-acyltransferase
MTAVNRIMLCTLVVLAIALPGMRYNISIVAWVMFVPLLILLRDTNGIKGWLSVFALLQLAFFLQVVKIVTDPMPLVMAMLFSAPMAIGSFVIVWIFEVFRRRVGELPSVFFFAALMSVSEWLTFTTTELGSWGAMVYTQLDDLAFLQMSSLLGITLPSFFLYLSSAFIAAMLVSTQKRSLLKPALASLTVFLFFYVYGVARLENSQHATNLRVAAIASDMQITPAGIPDNDYLRKGTDSLLDKTRQAIQWGAKLVAWNEGATIIFAEDEEDFIEMLKQLSQQGADLVIAYIVPLDGIRNFENKYLYLSQGAVLDEYFKRHPVPGEPAVKGETLAAVVDLGGMHISGAICYDFDFPTLGRSLSQQGIDIAVVPSSDWKGIDPVHAQMASVRAIEGGYALLRPARGATSVAFDAYGRVLASMAYFEDNDRIMMASIPGEQVATLYSRVGDVFPIALLLFMVSVVVRYRASLIPLFCAPATQS